MDSNSTDPLAQDTGIARHRFRSTKDWLKDRERKRKEYREYADLKEIMTGVRPTWEQWEADRPKGRKK